MQVGADEPPPIRACSARIVRSQLVLTARVNGKRAWWGFGVWVPPLVKRQEPPAALGDRAPSIAHRGAGSGTAPGQCGWGPPFAGLHGG